MDCNMSPLQNDWENLITFGASQPETHEKQLPMSWEIQKGEGIESLLPSFSGFDGGSSDSVSNFWFNALSKGSQSTSVGSSPLDVKSSKFISNKHEGFLVDSCNNLVSVQNKLSPVLKASVLSAEPLLGLKLGKRTYFEDVCNGGSNDGGSNSSTNLKPSSASKKSRSDDRSIQITRCQVEGCDLDLSSAKEYHRKHRVCGSHSKCSKVIVGGVERRFCQQCSRFHGLSEFDGKKRSCRKRLSDHNARRRKPRPGMGIFPLNPPRIYDEKQHPGFVWNGLSLYTGDQDKFVWEDTCSRMPTQTEGFTLSFPKAKDIKGQLRPSNSSQAPNSIPEYHHNHGRLLTGKTNFISFQVPTKGVEDFSSSSGLDETHGFDRALSLLSIKSLDSCDPGHVSLDQLTNNHEPPSMQPMSEAFPTLFM